MYFSKFTVAFRRIVDYFIEFHILGILKFFSMSGICGKMQIMITPEILLAYGPKIKTNGVI